MKFVQKDDGTWTVNIVNGDWERDDGFDTAMNVSLLTDARAPSNIVPIAKNRRGWIGDLFNTVADRVLGSLLWTLDQKRLRQTEVNQAVSYASQALNWFIADGLVKNIEVSGAIVPKRGIRLTILITAPTGEVITRYLDLWENTGRQTSVQSTRVEQNQIEFTRSFPQQMQNWYTVLTDSGIDDILL